MCAVVDTSQYKVHDAVVAVCCEVNNEKKLYKTPPGLKCTFYQRVGGVHSRGVFVV